VLRFAYALVSARYIWKKRAALRSTVNMRCLLTDIGLVMPVCIANAIVRLANPLAALGTDITITVLLLGGSVANTIVYCFFEVSSFKMLLAAHLMNKATPEFDRQVRAFKRQQVFIVASFALNVVVCFIALGLDHTLGPVANGEWILLVLRGMCIVVWQTNMAVSSYMSYRNLVAQLDTLVPKSPQMRDGLLAATNHAQAVVSFLKATMRSNVIKSIVSATVCASCDALVIHAGANAQGKKTPSSPSRPSGPTRRSSPRLPWPSCSSLWPLGASCTSRASAPRARPPRRRAALTARWTTTAAPSSSSSSRGGPRSSRRARWIERCC